MSAPPFMKAGCSKRLELHAASFAAATHHLTATEVGELFLLLVSEAAHLPVPTTFSKLAVEAYGERDGYRRIKGSFGRESLPKAVREAVFARDGAVCRYCDAQLTWASYHCDHVHPVSRRGDSSMQNLAAACEACNRSKGAKTLDEWKPGQ